MPLYDFACEPCRKVQEVKLPADRRDTETVTCPKCGKAMKRQMSVPMATLWAGKFHSPWAKKQRDELGDIQW